MAQSNIIPDPADPASSPASGSVASAVARTSQFADQLRKRAARLQARATLTLLLIIATTFAGVASFVTAERISADPVRVGYLEEISRGTAAIEEMSIRVGEIRDLTKQMTEDPSPGTTMAGPNPAADVAAPSRFGTVVPPLGAAEPLLQREDFPGQLSYLVRRADNLRAPVERWLTTSRSLGSALNTGGDTGRLLSSAATRLEVVILLIFLVQILVTLYRYNMRLAAHYNAQADALELASDGARLTYKDLMGLLSPQALDFGVAPKSPLQDVAKLIKAAAAGARGGTGASKAEG
jgi:hypothetical protein